MRFVSKSANFSAGNFRNAEEAIADPRTVVIDGKTRTTTSEAYVVNAAMPIQFSQLGLLTPDIEFALKQWKTWPGLAVEEDRITPANPVENGRIGVWDSEEFQAKYSLTDEDRVSAENLLLNSPYCGIDFVMVEEVKAAKPWPSFDDVHHSKVVALAGELGLLEETLAYELENKKRASVITQLEEQVAVLQAGEFVSA